MSMILHGHPFSFYTWKALIARALARPSVARAVDGGRPYRHYWVLGPTDRD